ncbi:MAG TPA: fumarylacetoacetate hydrolase family protein [Xanthobacteraceae bacterium]|nr:fumarylacetoacetate hydrolase family protein [Xanthobacteraceae bacterium]
MKICRFDDDRIGLVRADGMHDVTVVLDRLPPLRYPVPLGDQLIAHLAELMPHMEAAADAAQPRPLGSVCFKSPVANPGKIIGTPANYRAHVEEAKRDAEISVHSGGKVRAIEEMGLFLKANSSLVGTGEGIEIRHADRRTDHEAELGVVIGRTCVDISEDEALDYVAGYAIALDMVVRGKEDRSFRKSLDTYAVLGPWLVTADEIANPDSLDFSLAVNGEVRQAANTRDMIIPVAKQIAWAASFYTLHPGDIIMTGTCDGVGPVRPGDSMAVTLEGVGSAVVAVRGRQ